YTADPKKDRTATRYERLTYDQVIERKLAVMDTAAIALCRDNRLPLRIYDMGREGDLMRIVRGESVGTLVDIGK
ncbi:MAG: UMP kinase, partial [Proteobacteria bacterium]|nr:UMP kinase [Pseudomonadota bacterium]